MDLKLEFYLILLLSLSLSHGGSAQRPTATSLDDLVYNFDDPNAQLNDCHVGPESKVLDLDDRCQLITSPQVNETQLAAMEPTGLLNRVRYCACQLANMYELWEDTYDSDSSVRRLAEAVTNELTQARQDKRSAPDYMWSDLDVAVQGVSIQTATRDYFYQQQHNRSMLLSLKMRRDLEREPFYVLIRSVCLLVARDPHHLYRYMENIQRVSLPIFFSLLQIFELGERAYQASKACKLLLKPKLQYYRLRAEQTDFIVVDKDSISISQKAPSIENKQVQPLNLRDNSIMNDIDLELSGSASAQLLRCNLWVKGADLDYDCSMLMSDRVPDNWLTEHRAKPADLTLIAVRCGCRLLRHNATFARVMANENVTLLSKALTNYMNRNQVPDFGSTPIWALYGWFETIMHKFISNRKATIKEVVKESSNSEDPLQVKSKRDSDSALELIRRACNLIVFNHNKGSKENNGLKSIKYLDNLQLISQDTLFVFHLTLQDPNLFKLYALSKLCNPFVS